MADWVDDLSEEERAELDKSSSPEWLAPMLATLTDKRFSDSDWIYERKFDGERILVFRNGQDVRLVTRNRKAVNPAYPELVEAFGDMNAADFVVDGEVVAFKNKVTSFSRLQQRIQIRDPEQARASRVAVYFYAFDICYLDGYRLDGLPLRRRKALLRGALDFGHRVRFTAHRNAEGEAYFKEACEKGWEGVIAKRADASYTHGRSTDWLKFKCGKGQELVIGGFTEPQGEREGFGALLVGYYEDDELRYAGKVGTGYDDEFLVEFRTKLGALESDESPFCDGPEGNSVHWVKPELVGEFGFTEWTRAGRLRHPRFLGLRRDKSAREVTREDT